jgi:hypothetical protein
VPSLLGPVRIAAGARQPEKRILDPLAVELLRERAGGGSAQQSIHYGSGSQRGRDRFEEPLSGERVHGERAIADA